MSVWQWVWIDRLRGQTVLATMMLVVLCCACGTASESAPYVEKDFLLLNTDADQPVGKTLLSTVRQLLRCEYRKDWSEFGHLWVGDAACWVSNFVTMEEKNRPLSRLGGGDKKRHFIVDGKWHARDGNQALVRMVVFEMPPIETYSPAWVGNSQQPKSAHIRYYSLAKTNDLWLASHTICDALANHVTHSEDSADRFFSEIRPTAAEKSDGVDVPVNRIKAFCAASNFRALAWGKDLRVRGKNLKNVDRSDRLDLTDAENVLASMMSARKIGDLDWLASHMDGADREVLKNDVRKSGGPEKLSRFLKMAANNYLRDLQVFATAMGADEKPYALVAYVSKMEVLGRMQPLLNAVPFRNENGRWVSSRSKDGALCEEFVRVCRIPFLFWKSELASENLLK
ncbi:MAG: hypothetical protein N2689_07380 [Verrucomicrobiae bacterium]|nr:hypothetical protein [Verrucomicrobiae bacterium]